MSFHIEWKQKEIHVSSSVVEASNKEKIGVENIQDQNSETEEGKLDEDANFSVKKFEPLAEISQMCNVVVVKPLDDAKSMDIIRA